MKWIIFALAAAVLMACSSPVQHQAMQGKWIRIDETQVMHDPQTSALVSWRGKLVTLSDRSASDTQQMQLHVLDHATTKVINSMAISLAPEVTQGCFAGYVGNQPDLEALVVDPDDDSIFIAVTEDASDYSLSPECAQKYASSGSTEYPTLLLRLQLQSDGNVVMTHARPIQYSSDMAVGNFPNDGIEGLAFGPQRQLYLGLEKDAAGQPRIFSLKIGDDFWQHSGFAQVVDPQLLTPTFEKGNHPINAMDYWPAGDGNGYLLAAARNDNQLWIVDLDKRKPTQVLELLFYSEKGDCPDLAVMDNASIEGIAVVGDTLWMVNDPWKVNYLKNVQCEGHRDAYQQMAPLLFNMPMDPNWAD